MKALRTLILSWASVTALLVPLVRSAGAQESPAPTSTLPANNVQQPTTPAPPVLRLTLEDALARARKNSRNSWPRKPMPRLPARIATRQPRRCFPPSLTTMRRSTRSSVPATTSDSSPTMPLTNTSARPTFMKPSVFCRFRITAGLPRRLLLRRRALKLLRAALLLRLYRVITPSPPRSLSWKPQRKTERRATVS